MLKAESLQQGKGSRVFYHTADVSLGLATTVTRLRHGHNSGQAGLSFGTYRSTTEVTRAHAARWGRS